MGQIDWEDIQGLVRHGYGPEKYSAYVLWRLKPGQTEQAKAWLAGLAGRLTRADRDDEAQAPDGRGQRKREKSPGAGAINLALTASGLRTLGVKEDELARFSAEFREGMAPRPESPSAVPRRCNLLGDLGDNSPQHWRWGGWGENCHIDGLLLLFAETSDLLDVLLEAEIAAMQDVAEPLPVTLKGRLFGDEKEHFGFKDGVSNPIFEGTRRFDDASKKDRQISAIELGEFVLGYKNERNEKISYSHAPTSRNLGRNGTYLVFRQLEQDVRAFRNFVSETAERIHGAANKETEEWVASRMVGRSYEGEPLIPPGASSVQAGQRAASGTSACPASRKADKKTEERVAAPIAEQILGRTRDVSIPARTASRKATQPRNDFLYHFEDRFGVACPLGAHIRRANPRDILGPDPNTALRLSKMHRIIRRGRSYGERLPADGAVANDGNERGLHFICLNASLAGQFELIQHTWLNNPHFNRLYDEADPLGHFHEHNAMTIQSRPTNLRLESLPRFVTVRGGGYFFMPGVTALQSLARAQPE